VGPAAKAIIPTYGILIHGVSTETDTEKTQDIADKIRWNNANLRDAQITYTGWLTKDLKGKRASSVVVEFDNPRHANEAILSSIVLGAQLFTCEYYDRDCKLKQCFRCQKYGHIGTHCNAVETCSYCAGHHDSRRCEEKGKTPKPEPKCANCGGKHPSWSPHCAIRKTARAQLEVVKRNRPHLHCEGVALGATETRHPHTSTTTRSTSGNANPLDLEAFPALTPTESTQGTQELLKKTGGSEKSRQQPGSRKRAPPSQKKGKQLTGESTSTDIVIFQSQSEAGTDTATRPALATISGNAKRRRTEDWAQKQAYDEALSQKTQFNPAGDIYEEL
jgi:hypothetical protein